MPGGLTLGFAMYLVYFSLSGDFMWAMMPEIKRTTMIWRPRWG